MMKRVKMEFESDSNGTLTLEIFDDYICAGLDDSEWLDDNPSLSYSTLIDESEELCTEVKEGLMLIAQAIIRDSAITRAGENPRDFTEEEKDTIFDYVLENDVPLDDVDFDDELIISHKIKQ